MSSRLALLLLLALSLGAGAERYRFRLTADYAVVEWSPHALHEWKPVPSPPPGSRDYEVSVAGVNWIDVRALQYSDLFHYRTVAGEVHATAEPPTLDSREHFDGTRVALLTALLGGLAVSGALWQSRRRSLAAQARQHELDTHQLRQEKTYYRADGRPPEQIDQFPVVRQLGQGGMATVFEVRHPDGTPGALKLPVQQLASDPEFRKRFWREMELGARLRHPGVIRIDYVNPETEGSSPPYYVMELLQGKTLDELPRPLPVETVRDYARQLLEALAYVHGQQIYHRDLKPANVMLLSSGRLKIMDFGLALLTEDDRTRLTASGQLLGTPAFMAPEQITGGPVGPATDLYAVGLIVYELLAGQLPFPPDTMQLLSQKLSAELPPLEGRLGAWVARMTAREPDQRFASAAEALAAL